jgi:hypothetical protein
MLSTKPMAVRKKQKSISADLAIFAVSPKTFILPPNPNCAPMKLTASPSQVTVAKFIKKSAREARPKTIARI